MRMIYKVLIGLVAAAALLGMAFVGGCQYKEIGDAKIQTKIQQQLTLAERQSAILQQSLDTETNLHQLVYFTINQEVTPNVNLIVETPGHAPVSRPAYYLTGFDVCLYNLGLQGTSATAGGIAAAPCAGAPDAYALTGLDFGAALSNALINFKQYADCRSVVANWQQWYAGLPASAKQ